MGQFMFFAILLGCLAVAFAISALWQKSRGFALALALLVPAAAGVVYWRQGAAPPTPNRSVATPPKTIPQAIAQLERLTQADPKKVLVAALLSQSGIARPASGDLETVPVSVTVAKNAKVEISLGRSVP